MVLVKIDFALEISIGFAFSPSPKHVDRWKISWLLLYIWVINILTQSRKTAILLVVSGKKKCYYFTAKRYSLWNKFTEFSSVDLQKKKKKRKKWIFIFFPCIKQGIIRAPVGATKKSGRQGAMWNYRIKTSCVLL